MKKFIMTTVLFLFILCSCKQTIDKKEYDLQVKIKDSLQMAIKTQQIQIDIFRKILDSITTTVLLNRKAAPLTDYAFTNISNACYREMAKNNIKQGSKKNLKFAKEILIAAFDQCGYNYQATLHKIAQTGFTPHERQFVVLCLMPIADMKSISKYSEVFQGQELKDVTRISEMVTNADRN